MSNEPFWLEDMIVMGHGAPNKISKLGGQIGRCAALYSPDDGEYYRIYPVPPGFVYDWRKVDVEVRESDKDGRKNSYAIYNYEDDWDEMYNHIVWQKDKNDDPIELERREKLKLARNLATDTFSSIKSNDRSFGLIRPQELEFVLRDNQEKSSQQTRLGDLDHSIMGQKDYAWEPALKYKCDGKCDSCDTGYHEQKIVEWGAYRHMKKDPDNKDHCMKLKDNYHIGEDNYEHYLLIGNMKRYPDSYIVVKLLRFKVREKGDQKVDDYF